MLRFTPNLKELTYSNGNLDKRGLQEIKDLEKLVLLNVVIEDIKQFGLLLFRSKNTMKTLHFYSSSCCILISEASTVRYIYNKLILLKSLKELKISGGNALCKHRNSEIPTKLENLTIIIPSHSYVYSLFTTLKRMKIEKLTLELKQCLHNISPMPPLIRFLRDKYLKQIKEQHKDLTIKYTPTIASN